MRKKAFIIVISLISACMLMSGGYGYWSKPLIITGNIEILEPPPQSIIVPTLVVPAPSAIPAIDTNQADSSSPQIQNNVDDTSSIDDLNLSMPADCEAPNNQQNTAAVPVSSDAASASEQAQYVEIYTSDDDVKEKTITDTANEPSVSTEIQSIITESKEQDMSNTSGN